VSGVASRLISAFTSARFTIRATSGSARLPEVFLLDVYSLTYTFLANSKRRTAQDTFVLHLSTSNL
jgi:hypothetical protein